MSLHGCEVGGQERRLTFFFFLTFAREFLFCLSEWSTLSCKVTQMLIDILLPKVKVKFLSRLVDSKLSNTYLPVFIFYQLLLCYVLNLLLIIEVSEESVVLGFVLYNFCSYKNIYNVLIKEF